MALDSYGNFARANVSCGTSGVAGEQPHSIALRGPAPRGNPFIALGKPGVALDAAAEQVRPEAAELRMHLVPVGADAFEVSVDWRRGSEPWRRVIDGAAFPFAAPAQARVAVAATTGGAKNIHEVQDLSVRPRLYPQAKLQLQPQVIRPGASSRLTLSLAEARGGRASLAAPLRIDLPRGVVVAARPEFSGNCLGELVATPGGSTVTVGSGTKFGGPAACTLSLNVSATTAGQYAIAVPRRAVELESGFNADAASASLSVQR